MEFQSTNDGGKIDFLIGNTTVAVFIPKFDYGIAVIFEFASEFQKYAQNIVKIFRCILAIKGTLPNFFVPEVHFLRNWMN